MSHAPTRVAIVTTHPIQYYAPWFRHLAAHPDLAVRVFYLWDFGVTKRRDPVFGQSILWDIPLLDGYEHEFVPNVSPRPGTDHFWGLLNPSLPRAVARYKPDSVLLLAYNFASTLAFLAAWRGRTPILFRGDSHRLVTRRGARERARRAAVARIFQAFSACLYVGRANRRYFEEHDVQGDRLFFAPHAVDNDRFTGGADSAMEAAVQWRLQLGIPRDHRVVLFAGKFEPKKRPLDLLHAFNRARIDRASLLFVGSGPDEAELRRCASGCPDVYFAPFQNQSLMPRTYAAGDIFVLPSCGHGETWGLAVNEAMCLGRPVIVSDHVGCAEDLVHTERTGLVFPAGDSDRLAMALRHALDNDARRIEWGSAARQLVQQYSYEATTRGLTNAVAAVAEMPRPFRQGVRQPGIVVR